MASATYTRLCVLRLSWIRLLCCSSPIWDGVDHHIRTCVISPLCYGRGGGCIPVECLKSAAVWASYPLKNTPNHYLPKTSYERDTGVKTGSDCSAFTSSRLAAKPPGTPQATLVRVVGWLFANSKFCSCSWNGKHCVFVLSGLQNIEYLIKTQFYLGWEISFRNQPSPVLSFLATVLIWSGLANCHVRPSYLLIAGRITSTLMVVGYC